MSSKDDGSKAFSGHKADSKSDAKHTDSSMSGDKSEGKGPVHPVVNVLSIDVQPSGCVEIGSPLDLQIEFELDRAVEEAYWQVQFLVDSGCNRIITKLGRTSPEYYADGESEMKFSVKSIDVSGIPPSALANAGLLMAVLMIEGEEVISVNMVVNVTNKEDGIYREILNPLL